MKVQLPLIVKKITLNTGTLLKIKALKMGVSCFIKVSPLCSFARRFWARICEMYFLKIHKTAAKNVE